MSGCLDGTYKTPEYDLEDEIEKEMKNNFYDDEKQNINIIKGEVDL